jgi:hypothetical protein
VCGVSDGDDSIAGLDLVHGDPCSCDGASESVRIDTFIVNKLLAWLRG